MVKSNIFSKKYYTMYSNTKSNTGPASAPLASTASTVSAASAIKSANISNFFKS